MTKKSNSKSGILVFIGLVFVMFFFINTSNKVTVSYIVNTPLNITIWEDELNGSAYLSVFLRSSSGAKDMAVNGATPVNYGYVVPSGFKVSAIRSFITIEDGGSEFIPSNFGAIAGSLSNGILVSVTSNGVIYILENWTNNRELRNTMFDFDTEFRVAGAYVGRWTFSKDFGGEGFTLNAGDSFNITIQDNLLALDYLSFRLKGKIE